MIKITREEIRRYRQLEDILINPDNIQFHSGLTNAQWDELNEIGKKMKEIDEMVDNVSDKPLYKVEYTFRGIPEIRHYFFVYAEDQKDAALYLAANEIPFYAIHGYEKIGGKDHE